MYRAGPLPDHCRWYSHLFVSVTDGDLLPPLPAPAPFPVGAGDGEPGAPAPDSPNPLPFRLQRLPCTALRTSGLAPAGLSAKSLRAGPRSRLPPAPNGDAPLPTLLRAPAELGVRPPGVGGELPSVAALLLAPTLLASAPLAALTNRGGVT